MAQVTSLRLAHLPVDQRVHIALFDNVQSAKYLRERLLSGDRDFDYAFIDAEMVRSQLFPVSTCKRRRLYPQTRPDSCSFRLCKRP